MMGLGNLLGNAEAVKKALAGVVVEAGNEYVRIRVNGLQKVLKIRLLDSPEPESKSRLEDALASAFDEAIVQSRLRAKEELERLLGLKVPDVI